MASNPGAVPPAGQAQTLSAGKTLVVMTVALFFIWGGLTSLNDILIPKLKGLFQLSYTEAMLTQFAFFTAYFVVSLPAGALIARMGYLRGIVIGLAVMAAGCVLFVPAGQYANYSVFLAALFILAGGITILQVAANPLISTLGSEATSHSRLTFAQAFNSLGTTIFPLFGAQLLLGSISTIDPTTLSGAALDSYRAQEAEIVGHAYLGLAAVMVVIALVFWLRRRALDGTKAQDVFGGLGLDLMKRPRLAFGVASIFLYVGAEVAIGSVIVNFLEQPNILGADPKTAGQMVSLYWGGAMVGRFIGAFVLRVISPGKVLAGVAIGASALAIAAAVQQGPAAGYCLLAVGLMNAIMFPTIFSLALEGLGERAPQGSGLLCMAIVGGAIIPLLTGKIADDYGLAIALIAPAVCYLAIALFGWSARRPSAS